MCFARAADHLQTPLSAALAPLQLKKPPTLACLSREKREEEACKQMFSKQTSHPVQANVLQTNQPPRASKCSSNKPATLCKQMFFKQTNHPVQANVLQTNQPPQKKKPRLFRKSNNNLQNKQKARIATKFQRERAKRFPTKLQLQTKSTTLGKAIQLFSSGHKERQRETRERKRGDERRRARQQARDPREMRERERTRRRLREREGRASTQLVKLRETELKAARNRKRA